MGADEFLAREVALADLHERDGAGHGIRFRQ